MTVAAVMIQGTGSDVGKSLVVAGLCRLYARRGLKVRPFKPQNMSNNAAVTADGGEIGRAQALQARAAGVAPSVHMNPVLLKPQGPSGSQLVLQGRVIGTSEARQYYQLKPTLLPAVLESFRRLEAEADLMLVEGAGSPAEINLRAGDIANMGFAEAADLPVVLVGDIDRGGVIASLVGTVALLPQPERDRIKGFIINKFRGDPGLFTEGLAVIRAHTGLPALGVVPWLEAVERLPAEDSVALATLTASAATRPGRPIRIAVPQLARIANFDDLDPLRLEPDVELLLIPPGRPLPGDADLVILPGSKATIPDLQFLRSQGWDVDLAGHVRRGGAVLGICGGYQMLGCSIDDPQGLEGLKGRVAGLGLLDVDTVLAGDKTLSEVGGRHLASGEGIGGFEMHLGRTTGQCCERPLLELDTPAGPRPDGACSADGRIAGTYVHGLFAADGFRHAFLSGLRARPESTLAYQATVDAALDLLADHLERHLDTDHLLTIARGR